MKLLRLLALLLALVLTFSLAGCGLFGGGEDSSSEQEESEEQDLEYPVEAGGVTLTARPGKVVSLTPALTEKLYGLGMDDRLVGVSDFCDYPESISALPLCGTAQMPDLGAIEQLDPHLIVSAVELPDEAMAELEQLGIPVAVFPYAETVDKLLNTYTGLARLLEGETSGRLIGESVADEFRGGLDTLRGKLESYTAENGRKSVLYLRLLDFTVATGDTFENELLAALCMDNIAAGHTGWLYPAEEAKSATGQAAFAGVDIIFMDEDFVTIKDLEQNEFYRGLPATIQDRYLYISSIELERQSLRTLDLLADMAAYAYPDAGVRPFGYRDRESGIYGGDREAQAEGDDMLGAVDEMYESGEQSA